MGVRAEAEPQSFLGDDMLMVLEGECSTYHSERRWTMSPPQCRLDVMVGRKAGRQEGRDLLVGSLLPHEDAEELGAIAQR